MEEKQYYEEFENGLVQRLVDVCLSKGMPDRVFPETEDIDAKWRSLAPEFLKDAVHNINSWPQFTLGCAAYAGMAAAKIWDADIDKFNSLTYANLLGSRGFDDMDDHIVKEILGHDLDGEIAKKLSGMWYSCAEAAMNLIDHEQIESATAKAYNILFRALTAMFRMGAAFQLKVMGYNYSSM